MYETFDHTADLGLRVRAADLPTLFAEAGCGLTSLIVEDISTVKEKVKVELTLPCEETEFLFFDWLNLILLRFENDRLLLSRFEVQMDETGIRSIGYGEPMDRTRHEPGHEVKAITYHGLRVEREGSGWLAEVIVDI